MSLAPGDQRQLTQIEEFLHRSDPELATMLAAFGYMVTRRPRSMPVPCAKAQAAPRLARLRCLALAVVVVLALGLMTVGIVLQ